MHRFVSSVRHHGIATFSAMTPIYLAFLYVIALIHFRVASAERGVLEPERPMVVKGLLRQILQP